MPFTNKEVRRNACSLSQPAAARWAFFGGPTKTKTPSSFLEGVLNFGICLELVDDVRGHEHGVVTSGIDIAAESVALHVMIPTNFQTA